MVEDFIGMSRIVEERGREVHSHPGFGAQWSMESRDIVSHDNVVTLSQ